MFVTGSDREVGEFVAKGVGMPVDEFGKFTAIGWSGDNGLYAGVVYHNYRKTDIELVVYSERVNWLTRKVLQYIFTYPYIQLGCVRTTAVTGRKNHRTRKLLLGVGYRLEGVCRKGMDGKQDAFIYGMLRDECKWLTSKTTHGQEINT